jgi:hypothetical protein
MPGGDPPPNPLRLHSSRKEKTGCNWERWVPFLDKCGAESMTHGEVARLVHDKFKIDGRPPATVLG